MSHVDGFVAAVPTAKRRRSRKLSCQMLAAFPPPDMGGPVRSYPSRSIADSRVIAHGPGPWRPSGNLMTTGVQQRADRLRQLPERAAAESCARKVEQGAEFWLVHPLHIARAKPHRLLEAPPRITGTLGVPRSLGVVEDHLVSAQRIEPGQEPGFVLAMRNHHFTRSSAGCLRGDPLQARPQLGGAVIVAVEEDEDCTAIRLLQCDADRPFQLRIMQKLMAFPADGFPRLNPPSLRFSDQSEKENRYRFDLTMALDNGLDLHGKAGSRSTGISSRSR